MLLVDPPPIVERAIEQVGGLFDIDVTTCRVNKGDVEQVGDLIHALKSPDLSLPVVAGSRIAWKVFRPVNLWSMTTTFVRGEGIFPGSDFGSERGLYSENEAPTGFPVVPACALDHTSLYEVVAAGENRVTNLLSTLLRWEEAGDYPEERHKANLRRAALRWLTPERHAIKVNWEERRGSHAAHDFHAALRIIHGAVLAGWVQPEKAEDAYQKTCEGRTCLRRSRMCGGI